MNSWRRTINEWVLVAEAVLLLAGVRVAMCVMSFRSVHRRMRRLMPLRPSMCAADDPDPVARAVGRADRLMRGRDTCLAKSIVLTSLLRRREIDAVVRIGIRRADRGIDAHAWVEDCHGRHFGVNDPGEFSCFPPL